ncbi:histone-fold-containing protein [Suhomyces tanzawaensis NRRL Y-17324]|uniref:DNA polymerase epsilon subunit D n=1 Tax=Suhomyces tanzawaensis NRRL Y-17324 TaxID=984487 RepID=A0A1E4SJP1_9ASCO|nr:histone-fold-containing protein [Suhomyces tanzawaensis NRRL Y-17324]ODV79652.1 histone-fold-containing protein [Suhomyces tanzawaensis NRRL Y-17324]
MPPKGWRKNADGQYPQPNKDSELVSIDDILFPKSTVQKLAKTIISDEEGGHNMIIAKDSLIALQRSATVFVSHMMFYARHVAKTSGRKTINTQDVFQALENAEFSGFLPEVKLKLSVYENAVNLKKKQKLELKVDEESSDPAAKKLKANQEIAIDRTEEEEAEEVEVEEDDEEDVAEPEDEDVDEDATKEEVEEVEVNPIAAISKDEQELQGPELEEPADEKDSSDEE